MGSIQTRQGKRFSRARHGDVVKAARRIPILTVAGSQPIPIEHDDMVKFKAFGLVCGE